MAGLLNLVPRYLPRYGMAPAGPGPSGRWCWCSPLIAFLITWLFDADVDAQGGAYATGVLVLMTSAAVAVTLSARRRQQRKRTVGFGVIAVVFIYTTVANIFERPDGIRIAAFFIAGHHRDLAALPGPAVLRTARHPRPHGPAGAGVHVRQRWTGPSRSSPTNRCA